MRFILGLITGIAVSSLFFLWYAKAKLIPSALQQTQQVAAAPTSESDDFTTFYERFHTDSIFQLAHIIFPLEGIPPRDTNGYIPANFRWQKDNWVMHKKFVDPDGAFNQEFSQLGDEMVIEQITDAKRIFGMQRRFAKMGGEWHLIYYAAMNQLMDDEEEVTSEEQEEESKG